MNGQEVARGDFSFLTEKSERFMLDDAFKAVEATPGGWEFLRDESPPAGQGYMFWQHPTLKAIADRLYDGHSGASYAITMRAMESIAKNGWNAWVAARAAQ